jgi:hypothetical protein
MNQFRSEGSQAAEEEVRHIHAGEKDIELDTAVDREKPEAPGESEDVTELPGE